MFKKLKTFYEKNRVYSILMIVSIVCILSIAIGVIIYFLGQTNKDRYGTRLEGIKSISESEKSKVESNINSKENIDSYEVNIKGKLIYIDIVLKTGAHTDAETLCQTIYDELSDKVKKDYDVQFIIDNIDKSVEENYPIMGYIKAGNSVIKWTNYAQ